MLTGARGSPAAQRCHIDQAVRGVGDPVNGEQRAHFVGNVPNRRQIRFRAKNVRCHRSPPWE